MTRIKLCGLSRECDIEAVNEIKPEYIGFVFAKKSKRYVTFETAAKLKVKLDDSIKAVGVFVDEAPDEIKSCVKVGAIDIVQLHGSEDNQFIRNLRAIVNVPIIKAITIASADDLANVNESAADYVLLDSGAGTGVSFDWSLLSNIERPYFLAGGLDCTNAALAVKKLHPYAVDVSSGIETDGVKDKNKMTEFVLNVRAEQ